MRAVRACGTQICTSASVSSLPIAPPSLPVSATTRISRSSAASTAAITFAELPEVDVAGLAEGLHLLGKDLAVAIVVADRGHDRAVGGQRQRRQREAFALETADQ